MPNEQLNNPVKIRKLKGEPASEGELTGFLRSGVMRSEGSKNEALNVECRVDLAYNAAHVLSLGALRAAGYRSESRYFVFQCTQHTLNLEPEQRRVFAN